MHEHTQRLALLPESRNHAQPASAHKWGRGFALYQSQRCLRLRNGLVWNADWWVALEGTTAGDHHLAGRSRHEAFTGQLTGLAWCQRYLGYVLDVQAGSPSGLSPSVDGPWEDSEEAVGKKSITSSSPFEISRICFLKGMTMQIYFNISALNLKNGSQN